MSVCATVRMAAAAVAGYLLGNLAGSVIASWVALAVAVAVTVGWDQLAARRAGGACGTGCRTLRTPWSRRTVAGAGEGDGGPSRS